LDSPSSKQQLRLPQSKLQSEQLLSLQTELAVQLISQPPPGQLSSQVAVVPQSSEQLPLAQTQLMTNPSVDSHTQEPAGSQPTTLPPAPASPPLPALPLPPTDESRSQSRMQPPAESGIERSTSQRIARRL
jgi:hypothetical protein